jgi:hypothetical protein
MEMPAAQEARRASFPPQETLKAFESVALFTSWRAVVGAIVTIVTHRTALFERVFGKDVTKPDAFARGIVKI